MHLYGYPIPNTPNFDAMQQKGEISVFRDCISPHSTTIAVLSKLFTFCDHESDKDWYEYNNLIDVMNTAGYKTHWLSNQESSGIWGNVAQIYAEHSTQHAFTRIRDSREDYGILDEELFPLVDKAIAERSEKNFYVVHLMGGHGLYYNRFPYIFSKFNKDDVKLPIADEKREVIAQYDNALYYNDYIVSGIIDKFRDEETLVIYVPDHGEAVYDEGGFAGHIEENPSRHMIEVPVIMWASDKFKAKYPEKWAAVQASVNRPYMTDDMIHTVLDLSDIHTAEFDPAKSIVNDKFDASRKRIFNDLDYDTQIRTGNIPPEEQ
jgi:heptose-I-phosphate ethanolaminephosphotransferase